MERKMEEAEATCEPLALRLVITMLATQRAQFSKEIEGRFLGLCHRLREIIRTNAPAS
jgi:hypothetical protein